MKSRFNILFYKIKAIFSKFPHKTQPLSIQLPTAPKTDRHGAFAGEQNWASQSNMSALKARLDSMRGHKRSKMIRKC